MDVCEFNGLFIMYGFEMIDVDGWAWRKSRQRGFSKCEQCIRPLCGQCKQQLAADVPLFACKSFGFFKLPRTRPGMAYLCP